MQNETPGGRHAVNTEDLRSMPRLLSAGGEMGAVTGNGYLDWQLAVISYQMYCAL